MTKIKFSEKPHLRAAYDKACNDYVKELLRMWELDDIYGYWNSNDVGTIYHLGEMHNFNMQEIIYIVENNITEDEVLQWEGYCLDAMEFEFPRPNLWSWHKGCPLVKQEVFDKLRKMKEALNKEIEKYK